MTELLIIACLVAIALWIVAGVIDAHAADRTPRPIAQPVQTHTPLPPTRRPMGASWARADHIPPGPGRHRRDGGTA